MKREEGLLTIEATLALSAMIFFVLFFVSFARVFHAQNVVSHSIIQAGNSIAVESYALKVKDELLVFRIVNLVKEIFGKEPDPLDEWESYGYPKLVREHFIRSLAEDEAKADAMLKALGMKEGLDDISFEGTVMEEYDIIIKAEYKVSLMFPLFGINSVTLRQNARAHMWGRGD